MKKPIKFYDIKIHIKIFAVSLSLCAVLSGCTTIFNTIVHASYISVKKQQVSVEVFKRYFEMVHYINQSTLPVGLSYQGLYNGRYCIVIETCRKSWLGFLGDEEIAVLQTIELSKQDADAVGVVFPKGGFPESERTKLPKNHKLDDIYKIWQNLKLPMPILDRATLDNWSPISKDSILRPENAQRYNATLLNERKS